MYPVEWDLLGVNRREKKINSNSKWDVNQKVVCLSRNNNLFIFWLTAQFPDFSRWLTFVFQAIIELLFTDSRVELYILYNTIFTDEFYKILNQFETLNQRILWNLINNKINFLKLFWKIIIFYPQKQFLCSNQLHKLQYKLYCIQYSKTSLCWTLHFTVYGWIYWNIQHDLYTYAIFILNMRNTENR